MIAIVFLALAMGTAITPAQNDTFWHLRSGQYMWQTGTFLTREPFSYTAFGTPLHDHWWLGQLAFFGLFQIGGPLLLTIAAGACAFVAVVGSYRLSQGPFEVRLVLLAFLIACTAPEWSVRPQVISLALLVAAAYLVERDRLAWLPAVCVLWANVHALVIFGVLVACAAALEALVWSRDRIRHDCAVAALSIAAPVLTPIGWRYWPRVFETVSMSKVLGLQEYRMPLELRDAPFWIALVLLAVLAVRHRRELRGAPRSTRILLIVAIALAAAAVSAARNVAFFAVIAAPVLARLPGHSVAVNAPARRVPMPVVVTASAATLLIASLVVMDRWREGGKHLGWQRIPAAAIAAVRNCPDPIFNRLSDGGYLMWALPERRVFIDSRMEAYPLSLLERSRAADVSGDYAGLFQQYGIRCAVVAVRSEMGRRLARDPRMTRTYSDDEYAVFVR